MKAVRSASLPAATFPSLHAQTPYANSITLLANYERAAGNSGYSSAFSSTFANARNTHVNFQNNSYDDTAWWGLARIDALQYLRHLEIARTRTEPGSPGAIGALAATSSTRASHNGESMLLLQCRRPGG